MQCVRLGRSGLWVSEISLGTLTFGREIEASAGGAIIDRFLAEGGNFIDTADIYSAGASEKAVGQSLKGRRNSVILTTKGGFPSSSDPNESGNSRRNLIRCVDQSLRNLQCEWIDLYQLHYWDPWTPLEETLSALNHLVEAGKIRYYGVSNFTAWQLACAVREARSSGYPEIVSCHLEYSLMIRDADRELLPYCEFDGVAAVPWSPLGGGILSGKYKGVDKLELGTRIGDPSPWPETTVGRLTPRNLSIVDGLREIAKEVGKTPSQVALNWTM